MIKEIKYRIKIIKKLKKNIKLIYYKIIKNNNYNNSSNSKKIK